MQLNTQKMVLEPAEFIESPNHDLRPKDARIELIVIHNISLPPNQYKTGWVEKFFLNQLDKNAHPYFAHIYQIKVSSHVFIDRDGLIKQFVPFDKRAWHAGQSCYDGKQECNDFSIGIELEGSDDEPFNDIQYAKLNQVIAILKDHYPLIKNNITGHSDIAPGRKTDPGPFFDWGRVI